MYTHMHTRVWVMASLRLPHRWLLRHPDGQKSNGLPLQHHGEPDVLGQHCKLPRLGSHVSVHVHTSLEKYYFSVHLVFCVFTFVLRESTESLSHTVCCASQSSKYETPLTISSYLYIKNIAFFFPKLQMITLIQRWSGKLFSLFLVSMTTVTTSLIKQAGVSKLECPLQLSGLQTLVDFK